MPVAAASNPAVRANAEGLATGRRPHIVVMGVAGCGKSAIGLKVAGRLGLCLIEGDDFHPISSVEKMQQGIALTDDDRAGWLRNLASRLSTATGGAVLTCSALKRAYREQLRAAVPQLRFVYLQISPDESLRRVTGRAGHFYPPSLVTSQFEALQDPTGEVGVLTLDAMQGVSELVAQVIRWAGAPDA